MNSGVVQEEKGDNNNHIVQTTTKHEKGILKDDTVVETIRIVSVQQKHLYGVYEVLKESFGTKRYMACIPVTDSYKEVCERFKSMPKAKWNLGAVAVVVRSNKNNCNEKGKDEENINENVNEEVVGYVQMTHIGLPMYPEGFHDCLPNEIYIEVLGVSDRARGKGIGTKLLEWCYNKAIVTKPTPTTTATTLSLEVLNGNRAIGLYERFGFVIQNSRSCCTNFLGCILICFFFGRPYGWSDCSNWGSSYMVMTLPISSTNNVPQNEQENQSSSIGSFINNLAQDDCDECENRDDVNISDTSLLD